MVLFTLIAAGIALYFGAKALHEPRPAVIAAAILWLLYAVYEWQVASRFDCNGPCNIRVDLALILPILLIASFFAIRASSQPAPAGKGFRMGGLAIGALVAAILAFVFLILIAAAEARTVWRDALSFETRLSGVPQDEGSFT